MNVVPLLDKKRKVVRYVAGTPAETARLAALTWPENADPGSGSAFDALKAKMIETLQNARITAEADGVSVGGNVFATDATSQTKYVGALVFIGLNPLYSGSWKTQNNGFVTLNSTGVRTLCMAVMAYIEACFAWERDVLESIEAASTVEQLMAIDMDAGRPQGQGLASKA